MAADPLIRVTGLRKAFAGHVVLADVRLEVRAGEAVALLGANGAGKTTLLRILATLTRPSRGTAFVLGHDCARAPERVRPHIGLVAHGDRIVILAARTIALDTPRASMGAEEIARLYRLHTEDGA